jgi:hypothetical protein
MRDDLSIGASGAPLLQAAISAAIGDEIPALSSEIWGMAWATVLDTFSGFSAIIDPRFSYWAEDVVATLEGARASTGYMKTIKRQRPRHRDTDFRYRFSGVQISNGSSR